MEPIAGCNQFYLHCHNLRIPLQLPLQLGTPRENSAEDRGIHSECSAFSLNHRSGVAGAKACNQGYSRKSFFSDSDRLPRAYRDQR